MRQIAMWAIALLFVVIAVTTGLAQEQKNLSEGRGLGVGLQAPCGFSFRYWLDERLGVEGGFFLLSLEDQIVGCLSGRLLFKLGDTRWLDFYATLGGVLPFGREAPPPSVFLMGGMEFSFSSPLAVNLEFGEAIDLRGRFSPQFGLGIHFYFLRQPPSGSTSF